MNTRRHAPATQRNREPITAVLARYLSATGNVLEIASGTGEHVSHFATAFPGIVFQPTDPDADARASIAAWSSDLANVRAPLALNVMAAHWENEPGIPAPLAAMLCINMIHISPWAATSGLMRGAGQLLPAGGVLYLYGPYRRDGRHSAPSNAAFDESLRQRNPQWGVRDLEAVIAAADAHGLALEEVVDMPANNLSVTLRRTAE